MEGAIVADENLLPGVRAELAAEQAQRVPDHEERRLERTPAATGEAHVDAQPA